LTDSNNQANADKTTLTIEQEIQKRREAVRPINERIARLREESVNAQVKDFHGASTVSHRVLPERNGRQPEHTSAASHGI